MNEAALIVACAAAEPAVAQHRATLDRAAYVGVPAHVTVLYPFAPELSEDDDRRLADLFAATPAFTMVCERTDWFGDAVLFVPPVDPAPLVSLTRSVEAAFPTCPMYGGAYDGVVPHLTVGHDQPLQVLQAAERAVAGRLPFTQLVDHVELWSGPALTTAPSGSWRRIRAHPLGAAH